MSGRTTNLTADVNLLVHPHVPELYRRRVAELEQLLDFGEERDEARELIRSMIERVASTPRAPAPLRSSSTVISERS